MTKAWFAYSGGNLLLPDNYLLTIDLPRCRNGFILCAIYADYVGEEFPAPLSVNIRRYIANGLTNGVPEPRVPAGSFKYVYMKPTLSAT
jgi:hypothetical protein